jgi:MYXO-CTERM domain-containing protein
VFKIRTLSGDDINNMDLMVGGMEQFEVTFLPPKVGDYNANLTLFLDMDPDGQRTIQVHGNALFVAAHGGGGCSTSGGSGAGMLLVLGALVLGALVLGKRRRA